MFVKQNNLIKKVFMVGVGIIPLVFWPWSDIPFEVPKVWFFCRWVEILTAVGLVQMVWLSGSKVRRPNPEMLLPAMVTVYLVLVILSSVMGVNLLKSLVGNYYRGDGLITLLHLVGLFFILKLFWDKSWGKDMVKAMTLGVFGIGLAVFLVKAGYLGGWGRWADGGIGVMFGILIS